MVKYAFETIHYVTSFCVLTRTGGMEAEM